MSLPPTNWLPPELPLPPRAHRRVASIAPAFSWAPFSLQAYPVPDVLASLEFLPTYPDRVHHRAAHRADYTSNTGALLTPAIAPLAWLPTYPDRAVGRHLKIAQHPSFSTPTYGDALMVAARMGWSPTVPITMPRHRYRLGIGAAVVERTAPVPCAEIIPLALTTPTLLNGVDTSPTLLALALTTPTLLNGDVC